MKFIYKLQHKVNQNITIFLGIELKISPSYFECQPYIVSCCTPIYFTIFWAFTPNFSRFRGNALDTFDIFSPLSKEIIA
jgi:hypothetical protein